MTDAIADPFAVTEEFDPFASSEDAASHAGPFIPWPKIDDVAGRLVVLVPRTFDKEAKVSEYAQRTFGMKPTQEEWRADLVVLDGPLPFQYEYRAKVPGVDGQPDTYNDAMHRFEALPALIPNWRVTAGNILGVLNRVHDGPKPFALGRIRAGYSAAEMRNGKTFAQFTAELEAFYKAPKGKKQPKPVWHLEVSDDPQDRAVALAWWKQASADGFKVS